MSSKQHQEESITVDAQALDRVWDIIRQRRIEPNPEVFERLVRTALEQEQVEYRLAEWVRTYWRLHRALRTTPPDKR